MTNRTFTATITDPSNVEVTPGVAPRIYFRRSTDANTLADNTSATDGWKYTEATNSGSTFTFIINNSLLFGGTGVAGGDSIYYFIVAQDEPGNVSINTGSFTALPSDVDLAAAQFPLFLQTVIRLFRLSAV